MFFIAEAALFSKGLTGSSHKGVISLFGEHFTKPGIVDRYLGRAINDAHDKRLIGDYGVDRTVAKEEAEDMLEAAQDFVGKVKDYLDKWAEQK